jgi:hypothetical protein
VLEEHRLPSREEVEEPVFHIDAVGPQAPTRAAEHPREFGADTIRPRGRAWRGRQLTQFAVLPHPDGSDGYVAVHGGETPDAITTGAHLHWQLLPDCLVYDGERVVEWGHFDNGWRPARPGGDPQAGRAQTSQVDAPPTG